MMEYIALNNGVKCPVLGIGTFMLSPAEAENSVREALKMGFVVIPGSKNVEHIKDNMDILDFTLTDAEMAVITYTSVLNAAAYGAKGVYRMYGSHFYGKRNGEWIAVNLFRG